MSIHEDIRLRAEQSRLILTQAFRDGRITFEQYERATAQLDNQLGGVSEPAMLDGEIDSPRLN